ncbi:MAG: hypothetical protein DRI23_10800 [Candidatus Cloacimonadota bacterium]|nr:MAG: hypothetical protein DRI23_10800 [Candidatus Cloacimonadota bacterium]
MKRIIITFLLFVTVSIFAMDNEFVMHEITNSNAEGMEISAIDFDNDGDQDLISAGLDCTLWVNDGLGNFTETDLHTNTQAARSIRAADLDNDGDNDVVYAVTGSNLVVILENTGTSFNYIEFDTSLVWPHTIDLKDLDSDGDCDILCCEFDMSAAFSDVVWWENLGNLDFSEKIIIYDSFQQSTYVFADYIDSDDHMDVVACCEELSDVMWWQNDGNQNFGTGNMIDPDFFRTHTIIGRDLDLDGDLDILGAACMGSLLAWYENDGEGGFTRNDIDTFGGALWLDCADFDNDGDNDLFAVGQGPNYMCIYENLGNENFVEYPLPGLFEDGFGEAAADFDNDGDMDLAAIGRSSQQICWWENKLYGAYFEVNYQTGNYPLDVQFVDLSSLPEDIVSWSWDFDNDGIIDSNLQHPAWIYESPGSYSITLEISDGTNSAIISTEDYITVFSGHTALEYDAAESHSLCSAQDIMNITNAFTFEAWIYPYSYGPDAAFGLGRIFDKSVISMFLNNQFPLYPDQSLVVQMQHSDGTVSTSTTVATSLQLDQWQHVAVSYDGIDQVKMFVGGYQMMFNQPTAPTGAIEDNSEDNLYIGNLEALHKGFDGIIDEIRLWNYFMDQNEILSRMNSYLTGNENGLVHYWQINEGNGEYLFDLAGNCDASISEAEWCEGIELEPVSIDDHQIIDHEDEFVNLSCYPNPFNPSTTISFSVPQTSSFVNLEIYNLKGQKVKNLSVSLSSAQQSIEGYGKINSNVSRPSTELRMTQAGSNTYSIVWNGTDDNDQPVSSGVYLVRLNTGNTQVSKKMLLMK